MLGCTRTLHLTLRLTLSLLIASPLLTPADAAPPPLEIKVLSNRADLVSGGDALVEIVLPPRVPAASVRVDVDGRDVTAAFAVRANARFMGVLTGLAVGANVVTYTNSGLSANTTYSYRLVGENTSGLAGGNILTFKTKR